VIDAAATGAGQGVQLLLSIAAMLIAFIGLIALVNFILQAVIHVSLQEIFGYLFAPFALVMGVPAGEILTVGKLLGTKTVLNEFLAYQEMQGLVAQGLLSPRAQVISVYALCGFANFGSIAILIGGLGEIIPDRRSEVASLGIRALVAGTLSTFMTACFAGILA
jgi:CNT family concentrative nucleoside transporter